MKCGEIMTPNPKMCVPEDNVAVAVNLMWDYDCGSIPVVKNLANGELVGMVTDRDIAMHVVRHAYIHPSSVKVSDCMSAPAVACKLKDSLETAARLMGKHQIRRVPVVDENGCCVGTISQADLLSRADDVELIIGVLRKISAPRSKKRTPVRKKSTAETKAPAATSKKKDEE